MVDYILPDELAGELKVPWGILYRGEAPQVPFDGGAPLIAVGDVTHQNIQAAGLWPKVAVVDHVTRRNVPHIPDPKVSDADGNADADLDAAGASAGDEVPTKGQGDRDILTLKVANPAGTLSEALWRSMVLGLEHPGPVRVEVEGEEDLAALAAVALAPEGAQVAYGQPQEGMVVITVDEAVRAKAYELLAKMEER